MVFLSEYWAQVTSVHVSSDSGSKCVFYCRPAVNSIKFLCNFMLGY